MGADVSCPPHEHGAREGGVRSQQTEGDGWAQCGARAALRRTTGAAHRGRGKHKTSHVRMVSGMWLGGGRGGGGRQSRTGRHAFAQTSLPPPSRALSPCTRTRRRSPGACGARASGRSPRTRERGVCVNPPFKDPNPGRFPTRSPTCLPAFAAAHGERGAYAVRTLGVWCLGLSRARSAWRSTCCGADVGRSGWGTLGTRRAKEGEDELAAACR
jgi:hypothetical protein